MREFYQLLYWGVVCTPNCSLQKKVAFSLKITVKITMNKKFIQYAKSVSFCDVEVGKESSEDSPGDAELFFLCSSVPINDFSTRLGS